jgi:multidrug efflux pump subunit AcrA (membrane-fusion protein)
MGYSDQQRFYDQQQRDFQTAQAAAAALENAERIKAETELQAVLKAMTPEARRAYDADQAARAHEQTKQLEAQAKAKAEKDAAARARNALPFVEKLKIAVSGDPSLLEHTEWWKSLPPAMQRDAEVRRIVGSFVYDRLPANDSGCGCDHRPYPVIDRGADESKTPLNPHGHFAVTRAGQVSQCAWSSKRLFRPANWTNYDSARDARSYTDLVYLFGKLLQGDPLPTYISAKDYANKNRSIPYS